MPTSRLRFITLYYSIRSGKNIILLKLSFGVGVLLNVSQIKMVNFLLARNANPLSEDKNGRTAVDIAKLRGETLSKL